MTTKSRKRHSITTIYIYVYVSGNMIEFPGHNLYICFYKTSKTDSAHNFIIIYMSLETADRSTYSIRLTCALLSWCYSDWNFASAGVVTG